MELDTAPTVDLNKVLDEMRCQYERVLANNRRDAEEWFAAQVSALGKGHTSGRAPCLSSLTGPLFQTEELNQQQMSSAEQLQGCQTEMLELKRTANALEIELQAQQTLVRGMNSVSLCQQHPRDAVLFDRSPGRCSQFSSRCGHPITLAGISLPFFTYLTILEAE